MQAEIRHSAFTKCDAPITKASSHLCQVGGKKRNMVECTGANDVKRALDAEVICSRRRIVRIDTDNVNDRFVAVVEPNSRKLEWRPRPNL